MYNIICCKECETFKAFEIREGLFEIKSRLFGRITYGKIVRGEFFDKSEFVFGNSDMLIHRNIRYLQVGHCYDEKIDINNNIFDPLTRDILSDKKLIEGNFLPKHSKNLCDIESIIFLPNFLEEQTEKFFENYDQKIAEIAKIIQKKHYIDITYDKFKEEYELLFPGNKRFFCAHRMSDMDVLWMGLERIL